MADNAFLTKVRQKQVDFANITVSAIFSYQFQNKTIIFFYGSLMHLRIASFFLA
jgi:hypothetical protein